MTTIDTKIEFYNRAKKEYENAVKPFTYELSLLSTQPKPKKFMILLNKFVEIFKKGMKYEYQPDDDDESKDNYWNQLQKFYSETQYEMAFIDTLYEKKKNKLRLYFGLLLNNKKLFDTLKEIPTKLGYMYEDPKKKVQGLDQELELVSFLKEADFIILSDTVTEFEKYAEQRKREEKMKQKLAEIERKKQQELQEAKRKKKEQERLQKQAKERQEQQRIERQNKQRLLKQKQQQKLNATKSQTPKPPIQLQDQFMSFIPQNYQTQYANNKQNQQVKRPSYVNQPVYDLPQRNKPKKHQKASQILYQDKFKDQFEVFSFHLKPDMQSSSEKKNVCAECNASLQQGFYFIGGNQNQCYYTGDWFCNEHIAQERIAIPWKALQSFDLRGYPVSRKSYIEIKSYYEKPIIEIKNESPVVKQSKPLYQFLVLKRQIHLMYDSICDLQLMQPLLKKKLNYCLKQNLFSLKNLYDIYNGHQGPSLQKQYDILSKHFYRCERCQKRKGYICPKCKDPVKIFAFELKETHGCSNCRKLYHRKCINGGKCDCQQD